MLFINDLPLSLKNSISSVDLYAADTTIYDIISDKLTLELNFQNALDLIRNWCLENGMRIDTEKTNMMLITSRQKRTILSGDTLKLACNKLDLQISNNEKMLGVHIDENLQ